MQQRQRYNRIVSFMGGLVAIIAGYLCAVSADWYRHNAVCWCNSHIYRGDNDECGGAGTDYGHLLLAVWLG